MSDKQTHAKATFAVRQWDETTWDGQPWNQVSGEKVTAAVVTRTYRGDIEGEGTVRFLMVYRADDSASYIGLERFEGRIGAHEGSVVWEHKGEYADGTATASFTVVAGTGTGGLRGLRGQGTSSASGHQPEYPVTLEYTVEAEVASY